MASAPFSKVLDLMILKKFRGFFELVSSDQERVELGILGHLLLLLCSRLGFFEARYFVVAAVRGNPRRYLAGEPSQGPAAALSSS